MGWPSQRKISLGDFQPGHERKCATSSFFFDVCDYLVVANKIGFVEADGHTCLAELQQPLLYRLTGPDWAATRWSFASVRSF